MVKEWRNRYLTNVDTSTVESESDIEHDGTRSYQKGKPRIRQDSESSSYENGPPLPKPPTVPEISCFASHHDSVTATTSKQSDPSINEPRLHVFPHCDGNAFEILASASTTALPQQATLDVQQLKLKKLELISRKIDDLAEEVRDMKPMQPDVSVLTGSVPKHPAFTQEELEELNCYTLISSENAVKLAVSLSFVGGKSLKEATENVLAELMSNEVAMEYNWAGTKRGEFPKLAFKNMKLVSVVYEAVRKMKYHTAAQNSDIKTIIQYWLKNAKGRSCGWKKSSDTTESQNQIIASE